MATLLRPKITAVIVNKAKVAEIVGTKLRPAMRKEAERTGQEMVEEIVKIIHDKTERRPVERRKVNTTHLDQSWTYKIDTEGGEIRSVLTIKSGVNKKKIAALMFGTKHPYTIAPRIKPALRWMNKDGSWTRLKKGQVVHRNPKPGTIEYDGLDAMRIARDRVVRRRRGNRV